MVAGQFAIVLHYTDDENHAWRTWDALPGSMPWDFREQIEVIKRVAAKTRRPKLSTGRNVMPC